MGSLTQVYSSTGVSWVHVGVRAAAALSCCNYELSSAGCGSPGRGSRARTARQGSGLAARLTLPAAALPGGTPQGAHGAPAPGQRLADDDASRVRCGLVRVRAGRPDALRRGNAAAGSSTASARISASAAAFPLVEVGTEMVLEIFSGRAQRQKDGPHSEPDGNNQIGPRKTTCSPPHPAGGPGPGGSRLLDGPPPVISVA
jgi:hypothetical protein